MRDTDGPIGIFDSGFGGLTVARSVVDQMPNEDIVYLGDTARAPYGTKSLPEVREFALECLDRLVDRGVKALVIACNSASSAVLRDARERYTVPVVDVVLPAARRAVRVSRNGRILPWRRRLGTGNAPGWDLPLPERGLLPRLRGADQRRRCLLGLQRFRAGEPDPLPLSRSLRGRWRPGNSRLPLRPRARSVRPRWSR